MVFAVGCWALLLRSGGSAPASTLGQGYWRKLVADGVLDGGFLAHLACEEGPHSELWGRFRSMFQRQVESGAWGLPGMQWVTAGSAWDLIKASEEVMETWRLMDLKFGPGGPNSSVADSLSSYASIASKTAMRVVDVSVQASLILAHLQKSVREEPQTDAHGRASFGSDCLLGFIAATMAFGRGLTVLGDRRPGHDRDPNDDAFLLWRAEMGYFLGLVLDGEGSQVIDLLAAPGWPHVSGFLLEHTMSRPLRGGEMGLSADTIVIGEPRKPSAVRPARLPHVAVRHRATDPLGVVHGWRQPAHSPAPGTPLGDVPEWEPARPVRLLAMVSQHGALDLETPELLTQLFPRQLQVRYHLHGKHRQHLCEKTEGSSTMRRICAAAAGDPGAQGRPLQTATAAAAAVNADGPRLDSPLFKVNAVPVHGSPQLYFEGKDGALQPPDVVTVCSFIEALWFQVAFPHVPLIVFFGPPLLLHLAKPIEDGQAEVMADYWAGIQRLVDCHMEDRCLIAGESLFRSEQFFYQAGVEVPFLRPMSVWVNVTWAPVASAAAVGAPPPEVRRLSQGLAGWPSYRQTTHLRGQVLVHNRGRLRYEHFFITAAQLMAGPLFPYRVVAQAGRVVPFHELARSYHAMVILPWSPELCMLRHVFRMAMPIFVPSREQLANMVHLSNRRLVKKNFPYFLPVPGSDRDKVRAVHPYDPFLDTARGPGDTHGMEARQYWSEYSEYVLLPGLVRFDNIASLLVKLSEMRAGVLSARMRAAYLQDLAEARNFWALVLPRMLLASEGPRQRPATQGREPMGE